MNYFFGYSSNYIESMLTVPKFNNKGETNNMSIYKISIENQKWKISDNFHFVEENDFYKINNPDSDSIYILSTRDEILNFSADQLIDINSFTNTRPAFRSNFSIRNKMGGFSSYQLEYPHDMTNKKSGIVSIANSLFDKKADKLFLLFRNIYYRPVVQQFDLSIIELRDPSKILKTFKAYTNKTNFFEIDKIFLENEIVIVSKNYLGIPIYINEYRSGMMSMEHTHPPHTYIMGPEKFKLVDKFKKKYVR